MPLTWNEIKTRAVAFTKEWQGTTNENAEAKPFLIEFSFDLYEKYTAGLFGKSKEKK